MSPQKDTVLSDPDLKNIYLKMLDYLGRGDMAEKRLIKRIVRLRLRYPKTKRYFRYTEENCNKVIPLLREYGYIDEHRYARHVFEHLKDRNDGLRVIRVKMLTRDITPSVIDEMIAEFLERNTQDLEKIKRSASKKYIALKKSVPNQLRKRAIIGQKMYSWLTMRGFSNEEIKEILTSITPVEK